MRNQVYKRLYFQVLFGIVCGIMLGTFFPETATNMKPFGDAFIRLIKMMVPLIIFCTIVVGIAKMSDMQEVGRVGLKALIYFEVVSTVALILGFIIVNLYQPGVGMNVDLTTLDAGIFGVYVTKTKTSSTLNFFLNIIPTTVFSAFTQGEILQVLLFSVLFGISLSQLGKAGKMLVQLLEQSSHALFGVIGLIMKVAPFGAFGAMSFSVGKYGFSMLLPLAKLIVAVFSTCVLFIMLVLWPILHNTTGLSIWKFLKYIKEEIFIVLGTSSSEAALPRMITKLKNLGCAKSVVGLVIPTGYSFNLDGTSIYLSVAALFIAQAMNIELSLYQQLSLVGILMLTSKGAAAVSGGGFVILASTLSTIDTLPVAGLSLLVGIDIFMSEIRSVTNLIGNGVATLVISKWEKALDIKMATHILNGKIEHEAEQLEDRFDCKRIRLLFARKLSS